MNKTHLTMLVIWFLQKESQKSKKVLHFYCYKETKSYPGKKNVL